MCSTESVGIDERLAAVLQRLPALSTKLSDVRKVQLHYPGWKYRYDMTAILREIRDGFAERESGAA
jgi:hypothetical protein